MATSIFLIKKESECAAYRGRLVDPDEPELRGEDEEPDEELPDERGVLSNDGLGLELGLLSTRGRLVLLRGVLPELEGVALGLTEGCESLTRGRGGSGGALLFCAGTLRSLTAGVPRSVVVADGAAGVLPAAGAVLLRPCVAAGVAGVVELVFTP